MSPEQGRLAPYAPRVATEWDLDAPDSLHQTIPGSLVFVDISGFTALSERLARLGRQGAEELTMVLDTVFGAMLDSAYVRGGSLLKFGGDALLLLFQSPDHVLQATAAAVEMRATLRRAKDIQTSVGRVDLKMSVGVHTGDIDFFMVGDTHRELIVAGPTAWDTEHMEGTADGGEIVVSPQVAEALPKGWVGDPKGDGFLLRKRTVDVGPAGLVMRRIEGDDAIAPFIPAELREHLRTGSLNEHRIATIGFVRFSGVADLLAAEGPEATGVAIDEAIRAVQAATDREGITYLSSDIYPDGWKIIIIGGVPSSHPDDEGRVLRAGRQILDAGTRLPVQVGVNRGHVFSGDVGTEARRSYTIMGDDVNLAARVMAACTPGQVRATPEVLDRAATLFETTPMEPFAAKGKSEPVKTFEVGEETGSRPVQDWGVLPFGGRDEELASLRELLASAEGGSGGAVTIIGDTGLGKTRLLTEALATADDVRMLVSRGEPTSRDTPYRAIRDGIRRWFGVERGPQAEMAKALATSIRKLAPDLAWAIPLIGDIAHIEVEDTPETAPIEPRFRADRAADILADLLGRTDNVIVVVADDAHWTDEATTGLMARLAREAGQHPWVVAMAMRPGDESPGPVGTVIELGPLADEPVVEIINEATAATPLRPEDTAALAAKAGGNPLFLTELVRVVRTTGSADDLPDSLESVVSADIDALPELAKRLLRISSVLGRSFRRTVLEAFLAPEQVELDQATRRALDPFVEADGPTRWRFRHAVVHDLAYNSLPYRRRKELHARAAKVIERAAHGEVEPIAGILAGHHAEAGHHHEAWHFSLMAAEKAQREYANTEAATQYRRALDAARFIHPAGYLVAAAWTGLGDVLELSGRFEDAREAYGKALSFVEDPVDAADLYLRRARAWLPSGGFSAATRNVTMGSKPLDPKEPSQAKALAGLTSFRAGIHFQKGDPVTTLEVAAQAAELAEATGEEDALARAWIAMDWARFMLTGSTEGQHGEATIEILQRLGLQDRVSDVMNNLGGYAYMEGRWEDAAEWYRRAQDAAAKAGNPLSVADRGANLAELYIGQGRLDEARPLIDDAERAFRAAGVTSALPFVRLQRGRLALAEGFAEEAASILASAAADAAAVGDDWTEGLALVERAEALVRMGDLVKAARLLDTLESGGGAADFEPAICRVAALLAAAAGDDASEQLSKALRAAEGAGDLLEEARILELLATNEAAAPKNGRLIELSKQLGRLTTES